MNLFKKTKKPADRPVSKATSKFKNKTSWVPGVSGNPRGSSAKAQSQSLTDILMSHLDPLELAKRFIALIDEGYWPAIKYAYDRKDGLPKQAIEATVSGDLTIKFVSDFKGV